VLAREFWGVWESGPEFGTPMYYRAHILRYPGHSARVLKAIAGAQPGGVVVHCVGGRDRTGQIAMLALALAGVETAEISADYELTRARLSRLYAALGQSDEGPVLDAFLREHGTTAGAIIAATLGSIDVEAQLRSGGLDDDDLTALRARLLAQ
jgi:protein-tyrosine phosphatase